MSSEALERAQKSLVRLHGTAFSEDGKTCPACAVEDVLRELDAALAVAREREQPMREALEAVAAAYHEFYRAQGDYGLHELLNCERLVRVALVDGPAAATLAEPEQAERREHQCLDAPVKGTPPGSASAAADEPGETP